MSHNFQIATLANGCFWCTEAVFQRLNGVESVQSGYAGGHVKNPSYKQVCSGETGHAECLQITFDPEIISYEELLEVFWTTHDPTTLNRQGNDVGTQYRSVIFYHNDQQQQIAEASRQQLNDSHILENPIVTTIEPFSEFYPGEKEHFDYYNRHPEQSYCYFVVRPKVEKLKKYFSGKMKS